MREELLQQVALSLLPGIGPVTIRQLISYCGSVQNVFNSGLQSLSAIPGVGPKTAALIVSDSGRNQAAEQLRLAKIGSLYSFLY
jgi:DNA processing protein